MGEPADAASGVALVVLLPYKPDGGPLLAGNSMVNLPSQATWQLLNVSLAPAPDGGENVFPHVYVTGGCILIGDMGLYVSPPQ
jgi:hypothetical protein